jgi:hypothetical protein
LDDISGSLERLRGDNERFNMNFKKETSRV